MVLSTNKFYTNLKIIQNGKPCTIISSEFINPGKGKAFNRVRFRILHSGRIIEKIFKSGEFVEIADVYEIGDLTFLYRKEDYWNFINKKSFEEFSVDSGAIGKNKKWMVEQKNYSLIFWNRKVISIVPPNFLDLKIIDTDFNKRKDSIDPNNKRAVLETGAIIKVPFFLKVGDLIKVDTRSGTYISRQKK